MSAQGIEPSLYRRRVQRQAFPQGAEVLNTLLQTFYNGKF